MDVKFCIRLTVTVFTLLVCAYNIQGEDFVGDDDPISVNVQGRVQRGNMLFGYTNQFRIPGSEAFIRLQFCLCKSSRFRLSRPKFLQNALIRCDLETVSWDKPWVTLRFSFNKTILTEQGLTAGSRTLHTLLRDNLERYRVCDYLDAFTGRLYFFAYARKLIANAAVKVEAFARRSGPVNHTIMATEILRRLPAVFGLEAAFRNVILVQEYKSIEGPAYVYKFYFSEHILSLNAVDIYCSDFRVIAQKLLMREYQRPKEQFLSRAVIMGIDRAYEDVLDMENILKESTTLPSLVKLNFIPEDVICQPKRNTIPVV